MKENTPEQESEVKSEEIKRWFQDNLRIIVSIIIVVFIAGGIYSYSKRSESPVASNDESTQNIAADQNSNSDQSQAANVTNPKATVSPENVSKETEGSFIETAVKGDGLTVLARKAAANYLEKNPDSTLTKEHKIYIEDYLRKNVGRKGGVSVGNSVEFSKDLIQKAISQSKNLNARQLHNLQKYSVRVSSLS
jgi:hypothetical protein